MNFRPFVLKCWYPLFLIFFSFSLTTIQAQDTDFKRFSLSLNGGLTLGNVDEGIRFMASSFNVRTESTPTFGAGLQYAITPAWSIEAGYGYRQIRGEIENFETTVHLLTLKNIVNLNQLFFVNRVSNRVNPYITAGVGYDFFSYDSPTNQFDAQNTSYNLGAGVAVKLSNRFDLFTQYEYHLASNSVDDVEAGFGSDLINTVTGGIRINFGKKDSRHPSWRPVPVDISPSDYKSFKAQAEKTQKLEDRVNNIEQEVDQKDQKIEQLQEVRQKEVDMLTKRVKELENRVAKLEERIEKVKVDRETGLAKKLPAGHYVQIFASLTFENAQRVKDAAFKKLREHFDISKDKLIITKRKKFYEVSVGVFQNFDEALKIQDIVQEEHSDAFIITFPRPVTLQDDFKGLEVVGQ